MTATPPPAWAPAAPTSRWSAGRILALVFGILLLLPAVGLLLGGGALLIAGNSNRTSDGYLMSDTQRFSTPASALTSERLDLSTGADWVPVSSALGTARIQVSGTRGADVFVGIAPVADAQRYLAGVSRAVVDDLGNGATSQLQVDGGPPPGPPGDQNFWVAQAEGAGVQQLTWQPAQGSWMLVVMNADGSPGVSVTAAVGATAPSLSGLAWGLLITGVVLALIAALLLVLAFRRPRDRGFAPPSAPYPAGAYPGGGYPGGSPAPDPAGAPGGSQGWAPPAPRTPPATEQARPDPTPPDGR